jgi:ornithine--oxo-acid transaminase
MPFDITALIEAHAGEAHSLYEAHVNPRFARALRIIGFDRTYVRGKGAYLWDDKGRQYLDMLSGYGVFSVGRNHPVVKQALSDMMAADGSSLVQMETPLLCGVMAGELKRRVGYDLDNVYFCSTGAEGVESAIKFARRATGRNRILYASSAFHGLTTGPCRSTAPTSSAKASGRSATPRKCRSAMRKRCSARLPGATWRRSSSSRCRARG